MKFLIKIAIVILIARVLASTPRGTSRHLDTICDLRLRDVASEISASASSFGNSVKVWWTNSAPPKVALNRGTNARRPAD